MMVQASKLVSETTTLAGNLRICVSAEPMRISTPIVDRGRPVIDEGQSQWPALAV